MGADEEPRGVAIVGMACRFPGSPDLDAFWRNLESGTDCIRHFTPDELARAGVPERLLKRPDYVRAAPVIDGFDLFDAAFFEYSPREARLMDPQQRLLLETAWHAMEDAGTPPGAGDARVGAFMGSGGVVTSYLIANPSLHRAATGGVEHLANDKDFVSTKLSYKLGLTGPSINVQTACSTSLVAVHLACQSILDGECDMALAGAATVRVPHHAGYLYRQGDILSPDGRCRAYDARAEGTVFGSGVGVVVLKHVEDALADGDRIYAVIRGSALNNDGGAKVSYTASSAEGQARCMAAAFGVAEVAPSTIGYVEGHGTGTIVGDPLEVEALTRCFRTDRATRAGGCLLGSVKTNIGHLEQAAGVASLIKAALAVHRGVVPPSLNFEVPNPRIDLETGPFRVPVAATEWVAEGKRRAAVNSLGLGGTNAFAILEEAPVEAAAVAAEPPPVTLLTLSARTEGALGAMVDAWRDRLSGLDAGNAAGLAAAQAAGRAAMKHRLAVAAPDAEGLARALIARAGDARLAKSGRKLAFVFPGQGAQYPGMARAFHERDPAFRETFDRIAARMADCHGLDLPGLIWGEGDPARLAPTEVQQPSLFAIEVSLAAMLRAWGIVPDAVAGHSVGAFAAAVVAGIWTEEDAADLIATRGALMGALPAGGAMAALFADADEAARLIGGVEGAEIAARNSPANTVVAGPEAAVDAVLARAADAGVEARRLPVSHAFHSALMAPAAAPLAEAGARVAAGSPEIPFVSDLTGEAMGEAPDGDYLARHLLSPVRFEAVLTTLAGLGITDLVEAGPGAALRGFAAACVPGIEAHGLLDRKGDDWQAAGETLAALWEKGYPVDAARLMPAASRADLPLYPFERVRHWLDDAAAQPAEESGLAGEAVRLPGETRHFQSRWSAAARPWLPDHRVYGHLTLPVAAAMLALAEAGGRVLKAPAEVRGLTYEAGVVLGEDEERVLDLALDPGGQAVLSGAPPGGDAEWMRHLTAEVAPATPGPAAVSDPEGLLAECPDEVDPADFYATLDRIGLNYGPGFRNVRALRTGPGRAVARVALSAEAGEVEGAMHPALLDACLHLFPVLSGLHGDFRGEPDEAVTFLPVTVERFALFADQPPAEVWSDCRLRAGEDPAEGRYTLDIRILSPEGAPVAVIEGLTVKRLPREAFLPREKAAVEGWLHHLDWTARPALAEAEPGDGRWIVVAEDAADATPLADALAAAGRTAETISADALLAGTAPDGPAEGIVVVTGLSAPALMMQEVADLAAASERQFRLTRAAIDMAERLAEGGARLWYLTRGAQAPLDDRLGGEAMQAVLWGHGRVIALEHAHLFGGLIDTDGRTGWDAVVRELLASDGEDQVALRDGRRHSPRLVRQALDRPGGPVMPPIRGDASYLVTGGLGALGLKVAEWLVGQGARHLWLVGRRPPGEEAAAAIAELEAAGATVATHQADIADQAAVDALIARIAVEAPALDGVFHAAGLLDDGIAIEMEWEKYHRVTLPKIEGTWALHRATEDLGLSHFVLFSSILSVIGSMGQLNYVAGNAFQDAMVAFRRRLGLAATAMNWGPWEDAGLATESGERGRAIWRARGTEYIPADEGLSAMTEALANGVDHSVVTLTDWSVFVRQFERVPLLYERLAAGAGGSGRRVAVDPARVAEAMAGAGTDDRRAVLIDALGQITAANLQLAGPPDPDLSLREAGLDSLLAITVINDIEKVFGTRLPARALLRGPSVAELADMVAEALPAAEGGAAPAATAEIAHARETVGKTGGVTGQWLVTRRPRPEAAVRLFCFPFAGGGSAVFDSWADAFAPEIEIVAVEPPGRLARINEAPVRTVEDFARGLMPEMLEKLDRPYAVMGHCLGGLTLYETLRFLEHRKRPMPVHIFVSGARPPSALRAPGDFEEELEARLRGFADYRSGVPGFRQSDEVFAEVIRAFGISDSSRMLDVAELRELILPTVRAEFEMANRYVYLPEDPFPVPITCFRGTLDSYFRDIDARIWGKFTSRRFEVLSRETGHFGIVEDFDFVRAEIEARLLPRCAESA